MSPRAKAAAGGAFLALSQISVLVLGLFLMGYLTRSLGTYQYGLYALSMVLLNWFCMLLNTTCGAATIRLVAGQADGNRYAVTMLQMMGLISLAGGAAAWLLASFLTHFFKSPDLLRLLHIVALILPVNALAGVYGSIINAHGRFGVSALLNSLSWITQLLGAFFLIESGYAAQGAMFAVLLSGLINLLIGRLITGVPILSRERVSFAVLWRQSRRMIGVQFFMRIGQNIDLIAVKYFSGSGGAAGLYAGTQNISNAAIMLLSGPMNTTILQTLSQHVRESDLAGARHTADLFLRLMIVYSGVLVAHSVLSEGIVGLLLGKEFANSGILLAILLCVVAFRIVANSARTLIVANGETAKILPQLLLMLAASLAGFAVFVPRGGGIAAASVSLAFSIALAVVSIREALKVIQIRFPWATLARVGGAVVLTSVLSSLLPGNGLWVIAKLALATLIYGSILIALGEKHPSFKNAENYGNELLHLIRGRAILKRGD